MITSADPMRSSTQFAGPQRLDRTHLGVIVMSWTSVCMAIPSRDGGAGVTDPGDRLI
jgi:hypothetical protein